MAGDITGGSLSDLIFKTTGKAKLARRVVAAPGFLLAGAFVIPAALTANEFSSIACLAVSFFFLEWVIGPAWAVPMDVGGQFSGTVTGVMNMVGALGGASTAVVYGSLFNRGYWVAPFLVSAGVMLSGRADLDVPDQSRTVCGGKPGFGGSRFALTLPARACYQD